MADPIRLVDCAFALVSGAHRPEIGEVVTVALRGRVSMEIDATVATVETTDDGEVAILVDETGCRWALPIAAGQERSAA